MRNKFDQQLALLNEEMMKMGQMIETAIQEAVRAFTTEDVELAREIMERDEEVDREQKNIENICFDLLIQRQPVARDLRTITAAMKMVTDMERIGDHAADISELTVMMAESDAKIDTADIQKMAAETMVMLISSIEAYVDRDMEKASDVIAHDDVIDDMFAEIKVELINVIQEHPEDSSKAADLLMLIKYLERIGDHATNIAEWVIFSLDDQRK